ncbi:MAG: hypothetical protein IJC43_00535 [Clostridia bacterium]|nr:hypothetical protein [Clostridia bacterium]
MKLHKHLSLLLTVLLLLTLTACGGDDKETGLSGKYLIISGETAEQQLDYELLTLIELDKTYLKLNKDGTGEIFFQGEGDPEPITYDHAAKTMKFADGSDGNLTYTVKGDVITVTFGELYDDMVLTFALEGSSSYKDAVGSAGSGATATPTGDYSDWEGQWYGWWTIFDGDGYYYDYINYSWDCCVVIEPMDGNHLISIWDEDMNSYEDNCLAEVLVEIDLKKDEAVSVYDSRNQFWGVPVDSGDWVIDPDYAGVDDMLIIEDAFTDQNGDYCEYGVVLTRWGVEWNEIDSTYPPDYYESYFLPLMKQGKDLPAVFEP